MIRLKEKYVGSFEGVTLQKIAFLECQSWFYSAFLNRKVTSEWKSSQSVFTCSKLTIETLEQRVKYVQS